MAADAERARPGADPRREPRALAVVTALFAAVALLRVAVPNDVVGVTFAYVVPISLLALWFGRRGGLVGAAVGTAAVAVWHLLEETPLGAIDLAMRALVFALVGGLVGVQSDRRRALEGERETLIAQLSVAAEDPLTGLPNRRAWYERFDHELERARRSHDPLAILAVDLDHLKRINDTEGHASGDAFIAACAKAWTQALRTTDFVARVGGDEFLAVLPDCTETPARRVVERAFRSAPPGNPFSVGIAVWDGRESAAELARRADEALYEAKRAGRGRAAVAPPPRAPTG